MFLGKKEHNPPHIHAYYQGLKSTFNITTCEMIEGDLPQKQIRLIIAWMELHQDELIADWDLSQNGEKPYCIEPLK